MCLKILGITHRVCVILCILISWCYAYNKDTLHATYWLVWAVFFLCNLGKEERE